MAIARRNFYFPDVEDEAAQAQLETWLEWCNDEMVTGKVQTGWTAGDTSSTKQVDLSLSALKRREMILNDLSILDPDTYPPRDVVRIRRTVPRYLC